MDFRHTIKAPARRASVRAVAATPRLPWPPHPSSCVRRCRDAIAFLAAMGFSQADPLGFSIGSSRTDPADQIRRHLRIKRCDTDRRAGREEL